MTALQALRARAGRLALRIDALSLRERAILFVSALLVLVAAADRLALSPLLAEQKRLAAQIEARTGELATLRTQLAGAGTAADAQTPAGRLQSALLLQREQRTALEQEIAGLRAQRGAAAQLPELLERLLRRHERLTLVGLTVVNDTPPPGAPPGEGQRLRLQGVDLSLSGAYLDLAAYLAETERALPGLRWGNLQLSGGTEPPLLSVRLQLLEDTP